MQIRPTRKNEAIVYSILWMLLLTVSLFGVVSRSYAAIAAIVLGLLVSYWFRRQRGVQSFQEETKSLPELFTSILKVLLFRLDGADWKKLAINPVLLRVRQRSQSISHSTLPETADNVVLRRQVRRLAQLLIHSRINHSTSGDLRAFPVNEGSTDGRLL